MTVLLAYNDTPQGNAALLVAVDEARRRRSDVTVLGLTGIDSPRVPPGTGVAEVEKALGLLPEALRAPRPVYREHASIPAEAILDATEDLPVELVVLGARKRPEVGMFLIGTTTQRVLLDAGVPVLVVKAPGEGAAARAAHRQP